MRHALSDPTPRTDPPDDLEHPDAIEASPQSTCGWRSLPAVARRDGVPSADVRQLPDAQAV